ncbi:hypothetical protein AB0392_15720 [Nonomuraea angiospora]|uniref:hypothetical protein n=1 Tax=Nonomuraea angiospora TaxID=46172 RepID=UPI00344F72F3
MNWTEPTAVGVDGLPAHLITYLAREDLADDARLRATPSAFLAAFRRTVGTSPGRYLSGS